MERIRNLDRYPKIILILLVVMAVVFAGIYGFTTSRVGYLYNDTILVPRQADGATVYEGRLDGMDCAFTVTQDTVTLVCGKTYGPYTLREDPSVIPKDNPLAPYMTGIVITEGTKTIFRGGINEHDGGWYLASQDGDSTFTMITVMSDGTQVDANGNIIDPYEPTAHTIVELLQGPELTHKGAWPAWFCGIFLSLLTAVDILFADELFRFRMSFRVQDAYAIEPSDWELASRRIGWTVLFLTNLILYIVGLQ